MKTRNSIISFLFLLVLISCNGKIKKDKSTVVVEKGTEVAENKEYEKPKEVNKRTDPDKKQVISKNVVGFWVGYFERDDEEERNVGENVYADEGFYWSRENKINISIDEINDSIIIGHSVVAGNSRPFKGSYSSEKNKYVVKEPGDDKYDGVFTFEFINDKLEGKWRAYREINIRNRKYSLDKREFVYNPNQKLDESKRYIDWNKFIENKEVVEYDDETEEWISQQFSSATNKIYEINASNTLLTKDDVENLKRGDLTIIRNTIYARHGYSFKNRPLRVFFDAQPWYIPVHNDIRSNFTETEIKNIRLLLSYEENADEYYDYFGRG